jgi:hypothetical protein
MANTIQYGRRSITVIPDGATDFNITTIQDPCLLLNTVTGDFTVGETVTQATSGATGIVKKWNPHSLQLYLSQMIGTFDIAHTVTGASSTAHGIPSVVSYAFPNGIRLSAVRFTPSMGNDTLVVRGKGLATGPILFSLIAVSGADENRSVGGRSLREKPFIGYAEQTWNTAASCRIVLEYD